MGASINDVARMAQVSISTVSYVLNRGPRRISPQVTERVMKAVRDLDYRPSRIARGMVTGKGGAIGVVHAPMAYDLLGGTYIQGVLNGLAIEAQRLRHDLLVHTNALSDPPEKALDDVLDGRTDGVVVVCPAKDDRLVDLLAARMFPAVILSGNPREPIPFLACDNAQGMRLAFEHLYHLGHRKIGITRGTMTAHDGRARFDAYCALMQEFNLRYEPKWVAGNDFKAENGYAAAVKILSADIRPTAIIAGNDELARAALIAANERGLSVPRDLSIVGFDDTVLAQLTNPAMTSVHQPLEALGAAAVRIIDSLLAGQGSPKLMTFSTSLSVRGSTAPPPL